MKPLHLVQRQAKLFGDVLLALSSRGGGQSNGGRMPSRPRISVSRE